MPPASQNTQNHHWREFSKRGYYIWCKEHPNKWEPKRARAVLADITNQVGSAQR